VTDQTAVTVERGEEGVERVAVFGADLPAAAETAGLDRETLREATVELAPVTRAGLRRFEKHGDLFEDDEGIADYVDHLTFAEGWPPEPRDERTARAAGFDTDAVRRVGPGDEVGLGTVVSPGAGVESLGVHFDVGTPHLWFDRPGGQAAARAAMALRGLDRPTDPDRVLGLGTSTDERLVADEERERNAERDEGRGR